MKSFANKCAIVTGVSGQDGYYLSRILVDCGVHVVGTTRDSSRNIDVPEQVTVVEWDVQDQSAFAELLNTYRPDYIFNLAAFSSGSDMNKTPLNVAAVNGFSVLAMLETLRQICPTARFIQASSAEVFAGGYSSIQDETSCRVPRSVYGAAKIIADHTIALYRKEYDLFCASAILYNHESPKRRLEFVTRKITSAAAALSRGHQEVVVLGNLEARRDWGHARDYAAGMWRMAQAADADDYILATGQTHTVREFVEQAFRHVGIDLDWRGCGVNEAGVCLASGKVRVAVSADFFRPTEAYQLVGTITKAETKLQWKPMISFETLIAEMVDADLAALV